MNLVIFAAIFNRFEQDSVQNLILDELLPKYKSYFGSIPAYFIRACLALDNDKSVSIIEKIVKH